MEIHGDGGGIDFVAALIGALVEVSILFCFYFSWGLAFDFRIIFFVGFDRYFFFGYLKGVSNGDIIFF